MADETTGTESGTNWGSLIALLAGVLGAAGSGQSLFGEKAGQVSNTGPLTPEGQQIMAEYSKMLSTMPDTQTNRMGKVSVTMPNPGKMNILKHMIAMEAARKGNLSPQASEPGILGKLATLLAGSDTGKTNTKKNDPWGGVFRSGQGTGDTTGVGATQEGEDNYWKYGYDDATGEWAM